MKFRSIILTTGLFVVTSLTSNAQDWTLLGNSLSLGTATNPTNFFGTINPWDVLFKTSNTERMRITSTGNVGIGSTTSFLPQRKLVITNGGAEGIELHPFNTSGGYGQIIAYKRTTSTWLPLVLQDPTGGNVGVGNITPTYKLSIQTSTTNDGLQVKQTGTGAAGIHLDNTSAGGHNWGIFSNGSSNFEGAGTFSIYDYGVGGSGTFTTRFMISTSGCVGIGTITPDPLYLLSVNGKIRAKEIKVETGWSDFVFEKSYKLRSLFEVEQFIKINGHLPEIPSAKEVETEGVSVGEMESKLLQKIEELTLYIIEQNKRIESIQKELDKK